MQEVAQTVEQRQWRGKPWERQPDESPEAWEAWGVYRDMADERSTRAVAKHLDKSPSLIARWSKRFAWTFRYDQFSAIQSSAEAKAVERQVSKQAAMEAARKLRVVRAWHRIVYLESAKWLRLSMGVTKPVLGVDKLLALSDMAEKTARALAAQPAVAEDHTKVLEDFMAHLEGIRQKMIAANMREKGLPNSPREVNVGDDDDD